jgi:hypothetical protein
MTLATLTDAAPRARADNLVTDLYEWGWGQSFHFSPRLASYRDSL